MMNSVGSIIFALSLFFSHAMAMDTVFELNGLFEPTDIESTIVHCCSAGSDESDPISIDAERVVYYSALLRDDTLSTFDESEKNALRHVVVGHLECFLEKFEKNNYFIDLLAETMIKILCCFIKYDVHFFIETDVIVVAKKLYRVLDLKVTEKLSKKINADLEMELAVLLSNALSECRLSQQVLPRSCVIS